MGVEGTARNEFETVGRRVDVYGTDRSNRHSTFPWGVRPPTSPLSPEMEGQSNPTACAQPQTGGEHPYPTRLLAAQLATYSPVPIAARALRSPALAERSSATQKRPTTQVCAVDAAPLQRRRR
eukprot:CAMPEP_0119374442 /NCGR_PEP_ID=MMETSP1334-20130426/30605_1 /TAXON_ID=127549 /ORGANISM="Calcidiscus leptoporus, Strain RCC1130" /LENGTH=122 /DNA_ID=CAMNT_0007392515 /DNA_START=514 /DNA_END=878 /DNA_ORIENTATION=-